MENIPNVLMRLFQCKTQSSCTDVFCRRVRGFNKQSACLSHDVGKFVIEVKDDDICRAYVLVTIGETHVHLTRACVEHNAELRKTNEALCRGKTQRSTVLHSKSRCENGNAE